MCFLARFNACPIPLISVISYSCQNVIHIFRSLWIRAASPARMAAKSVSCCNENTYSCLTHGSFATDTCRESVAAPLLDHMMKVTEPVLGTGSSLGGIKSCIHSARVNAAGHLEVVPQEWIVQKVNSFLSTLGFPSMPPTDIGVIIFAMVSRASPEHASALTSVRSAGCLRCNYGVACPAPTRGRRVGCEP